MDSLEILKAKINLQTLIIKMTNSIEEIQKKHPERKDIIDSMLESAEDIAQFQSVFAQLEENLIIECKVNLRNQIIIHDLKQQNHKLRTDLRIKKERF